MAMKIIFQSYYFQEVPSDKEMYNFFKKECGEPFCICLNKKPVNKSHVEVMVAIFKYNPGMFAFAKNILKYTVQFIEHLEALHLNTGPITDFKCPLIDSSNHKSACHFLETIRDHEEMAINKFNIDFLNTFKIHKVPENFPCWHTYFGESFPSAAKREAFNEKYQRNFQVFQNFPDLLNNPPCFCCFTDG